MLMTLVSHTTNKEAGEHLTRCRVKKKESPSCSIKAPFSHSLFRRKEIMMNTHISTQEQDEMTVRPDAMVTDLEGLAAGGFTSEEIVSLLWLRQRYQTGGSDRVVLVRRWEFLKLLVLTGKLDVLRRQVYLFQVEGGSVMSSDLSGGQA